MGKMFRRKKAAAVLTAAAASAVMLFSTIGGIPAAADTYELPEVAVEQIEAQTKDISSCNVTLRSKNLFYSGRKKVPAVTVYDGSVKLVRNTDYKLTYSNNIEPGRAEVKVQGINNYSGSTTLNFNVRTVAVKQLTAEPSADSVMLTWTETHGADGYKVYQYNAEKRRYDLKTTISDPNARNFRVTGLKNNTAYIFRVKGFASAGTTNYPGAGKKVEVTTLAKADNTPVGQNGRLKVSGANIVNSRGEKFQIIGMSTHGLMWEDFSNITTEKSLKTLRDDWGVNTIRLAMYTEEWGGYTTGTEYAAQAKQKVITGVDNATKLGMYAVIDWHILSDGNPAKHQAQAVSFFTEMAKKYKNNENVIYEICNEPNGGVTWSGQIKPYAETVISAIRKQDPNAIIVVGTGTWSQDIHDVVNNRLTANNVVYTLHFYANTHTDWLRNRFTECYSKGLPILVSEFGTCDASGNGGFNASQTKTWISLLDSKMVGYINWSACGKNETASAFKPGTNLADIPAGESALTESGKLIRSLYRKRTGK